MLLPLLRPTVYRSTCERVVRVCKLGGRDRGRRAEHLPGSQWTADAAQWEAEVQQEMKSVLDIIIENKIRDFIEFLYRKTFENN